VSDIEIFVDVAELKVDQIGLNRANLHLQVRVVLVDGFENRHG
jgi:hypothetical protein